MTESKEWYDDWEINRLSDGKGLLTKTKISLPYSHADSHIVYFKRISDARVAWLIDALDSALSELSRRDKKND